MKRRNALQVIAAGAATPLAAQHASHGSSEAANSDELRFFTPEQFKLTDCVADMILPADDHSGGARDAGVAQFIDAVVAESEPAEQKAWKKGLRALDAEAKRRFRKAFVDGSADERDQILAELAAEERNPKTDLQHFFVQIKRHTISGYYTSRVGLLEELEYKGVYPIADYASCEHHEHGE